MADYSKLTKRELIMTLYARDLMLENERMIERNFEEKYKQKCNEISALKDSYEYALAEPKQQLHDLPKKIVGEIRKELNNIVEVGDYFDTETDEETNLLKQVDIENILDAILEKYGDKNESNND